MSCTDKPVFVSGFGLATDHPSLHEKSTFTGLVATTKAAGRAFEMADLTPADMDMAEVHDCFTITEILDIEDIGFFEKGKGGPATVEGATALDGRIPVNPSGGLLAKGHPIGATGVAQICECYWQLREEAGTRQVAIRHGHALQHNVGGRGSGFGRQHLEPRTCHTLRSPVGRQGRSAAHQYRRRRTWRFRAGNDHRRRQLPVGADADSRPSENRVDQTTAAGTGGHRPGAAPDDGGVREARRRKLGTEVEVFTTTDQRRALEGADFVVVTISTGGFPTMRVDLEVPAPPRDLPVGRRLRRSGRDQPGAAQHPGSRRHRQATWSRSARRVDAQHHQPDDVPHAVGVPRDVDQDGRALSRGRQLLVSTSPSHGECRTRRCARRWSG